MATRPSESVGRLAVSRARARIPDLAPVSVEVVELAREQAYVLVLTGGGGIAVLDAGGRLVRRRQLLATIARHAFAVERVRTAIVEASLDRRLDHATRSVVLLDGISRPEAVPVVDELRLLRSRLEAVVVDVERETLPTERTLRRRVTLVNEAARADRRVVRATRLAAAEPVRDDGSPARRTLRRWLVARLASPDLPFVHPELDDEDSVRHVDRLLASART